MPVRVPSVARARLVLVGALLAGLVPIASWAVPGAVAPLRLAPAAGVTLTSSSGAYTLSLSRALGAGSAIARFPAAAGLARVRVFGGGAAQVRLATGAEASAPATLNGYWQWLGLSVAHPGAVTLEAVTDLPAGTRLRASLDSLSTSGPSVTTASGRQILVNGTPLVFKGFSYGPQKIGDQTLSPASTWAQPAACQKDAALMHAAGVTAVRIGYDENEVTFHQQYIQCLDALAANGIGVVWLINGPGGVEGSENNAARTAWLTAYQQRVSTAIADLAAHPATLLWIVGNEISDHNSSPSVITDSYYWYGCRAGAGCGTAQVGAVDGLLAAARAADPDHLVGVTIDDAPARLTTADLPHLQFWGLNHYFPPSSPGTFFSDINSDPRPKLLTEFGVDRYHCAPGKVIVHSVASSTSPPSVTVQNDRGIVVSCATTAGDPVNSSHEDQQAQADWDAADWDVIQANLAPSSGAASVVGGILFMFSDLWSFSLGVFWPGTPVTHDVAGAYGPGFDYDNLPDHVFNPEWMGVAVGQPAHAAETRMTSLAYDALEGRWAGTPPPALTNLTFQVTGLLNAQVSWQTSEPTTSEIQFAYCDSPQNGQDLVSNDDLYHYPNPVNGLPDPTLTTNHSRQVGVMIGEPVRITVRSFTADGRSVTAPPIDVGWTSTTAQTCRN